jgi:hypothetical protein
MLLGRISAIPERSGDQPLDIQRLTADPHRRSAALADSAAACLAAQRHALDAVGAVPSPPAACILREFISALARPALAASRAYPRESRPGSGKVTGRPQRIPSDG